MKNQTLHITSSPHLTKALSTDQIMLNVVGALLPVTGFAIYVFGLNALLVIVTSTVSCVFTEHVLCKLANKETTISDWSAVITGILLGLTLPPIFPLWMTFVGGVVAIGLGKFVFGGLGTNVFNPALVGRAVLQAAFPVAIATWYSPMLGTRFSVIDSSVWTIPFMQPKVDALSGATPLAAWKFEQLTTNMDQLAFGFVGGSTGETSAVFILLGGLYLIARKMMNWRIPAAILITVFTLSGLLNLIDSQAFPPPMFMILSGGLMLGAVFMATDMVASPITSKGVITYGVLIGVLVVVIRIWGGLPEGVMYAILLANAVSPHIDNWFQPTVYGTSK